jgi:hypothetical protein
LVASAIGFGAAGLTGGWARSDTIVDIKASR